MKLNLGCGRDIRRDWVNIDALPRLGVDVALDLDERKRLPFPADEVSEIHASHVIEHLHHPLWLMGELWRVAEPGARAVFRCPYGSSDNADEDPTHVRRMFLQSWDYFGQPAYWRADYGYLGDWRATRITLFISDLFADAPVEDVWWGIRHQRNVVREMVAELVAVKPARAQDKSLQTLPEIILHRGGEHVGS